MRDRDREKEKARKEIMKESQSTVDDREIHCVFYSSGPQPF